MSISMEERLKRRKLDALKRGVHRATEGDAVAVASHIVGIGKAGAAVVAEALRTLRPGSPKLTALVVDIGEADLADVRNLAATIAPEQAEIIVVALEVPSRAALVAALERYPDFLTLEYPRYRPNPRYQPWLQQQFALPPAGEHHRRAVAKAIYGMSYYAAPKVSEQALRRFAASVDETVGHAMVAVVFGMGGGAGSGIAVDLARHLSNRAFGRRVLMAGIGIAPCDGDIAEHRGGNMFPLISELDTMGDEEKNRGIVMGCGDMFRNPFTAGFVMLPQQHGWLATHDLAATHERGNRELASLLTAQRCKHFWELLRLLNWVAAPSTQHSAARTPWGSRWIHMLGYADVNSGGIGTGPDLAVSLGLLPSYTPEFVELRVADQAEAGVVTEAISTALRPDVPPVVVEGGAPGSAQFILPCLGKTDLSEFVAWRSAYDAASAEDKLLDHSLLLEHAILLSAPSTRMAGMAGASLWGGDSWVAVPLDALRGELPASPSATTLQRLQNVRQAVA